MTMEQAFAGSSFTQSSTGYRAIATAWEREHYPQYDFDFDVQAIGGHNSYSALVRLQAGADVFVIDHANDANNSNRDDRRALEALIRRVWAANPNTRIIIVGSPVWNTVGVDDDANVDTPSNQTILEDIKALAEWYGIAYVDYWQWCRSVVPDTYTLAQLAPDSVHPSSEIGYPNMALLLQAYLPTGGTPKPAPLPARLYDNGDFENTPTVFLGNQYDSRTGTWSDAGTRTQSSEAGATITFSATCQSLGILRTDGDANAELELSVDGSAYRNVVLNQGGYFLEEGRGAHTLTIRVKTGGNVRIEQFWAV